MGQVRSALLKCRDKKQLILLGGTAVWKGLPRPRLCGEFITFSHNLVFRSRNPGQLWSAPSCLFWNQHSLCQGPSWIPWCVAIALMDSRAPWMALGGLRLAWPPGHRTSSPRVSVLSTHKSWMMVYVCFPGKNGSPLRQYSSFHSKA